MDDKTIYWLWLQKGLGFAAPIRELISYYGDAEALYNAGEASWRESGLFGTDLFEISSSKLVKLKNTSLEDGKAIIKQCKESGIDIITPDNALYPKSLKLIPNYPAVLFVRGDISCLNDELAIAVIGTRRPSQYGVSAAEKITKALARENVVIVSGGALGIDSIAHRSALSENAKTVLVLGCGHFSKYLAENEPLRNEVAQNGAVISEYPPMTGSGPILFPMRNRIISGVSKGVVIIEAGEKSGTLNTANHARKQGKDVFAVPGDISSIAYAGSNKLIKEGAKAIFSAEDILSYYRYTASAIKEIESSEPISPFDGIDRFMYGEPEKPKKNKAPSKRSKPKEKEEFSIETKEENAEEKIFSKFNQESVSNSAIIVYNNMSGEESDLDEITRSSGLPVRKVLTALTELEMANAIVSCGAGRYRKC